MRDKKRKKQEKEEEKYSKIRNMNQAWKVINKERKRKVGITNKFEISKWREYFADLLEGKEEVEAMRNEKGKERCTQGREITEEEVWKQIKKLKKGKTAGEDGIENKAWIYGGGIIVSRLTRLINKVWNGEYTRKLERGNYKPNF